VIESASWIALKTKLANNCPFSVDSELRSKNYNNCELNIEYEPLELRDVYNYDPVNIYDGNDVENESLAEVIHDYCLDICEELMPKKTYTTSKRIILQELTTNMLFGFR
jgi:hypothetical protein